MELINKDGKTYLKSYIVKIDNTKIDANKLFADITELHQSLLKGRKFISNKKEYGYPLQELLNRYSGTSTSPSFFKSFTTNPALQLMSNFFSDTDDKHIQIGNAFHNILDDFYKSNTRDSKTLERIVNEYDYKTIDKQEVFDLVRKYFTGLDYTKQPIDVKVKCETEKRIDGIINVKSLNESLPMRFTFYLDRIDFREDGIYLVDYKTGKHSEDGNTFDGYLTSMLLYKWAVEQTYNQEVKGVYLCYPRGKTKWVEIPRDKDTELKVFNYIQEHTKALKKIIRTKIFPYTDNGFFNSVDTVKFKALMNNSLLYNVKIPIEIYVG